MNEVFAMCILQATKLKKEYRVGNQVMPILKDVSLAIDQGDFVFIVGPSGSGKTTLLYVLSGLEDFEDGSVEILGKSLEKMTQKQKSALRALHIGFVFQFYNLIPNLTVMENIELSQSFKGKVAKDEILEALEWVQMKEYKDYFPHQLSGGMQQKVAIARCLVNDPDVIFADEPTGNLDYKNGKMIMELFARINKEKHKTIIMVTHNEDMMKYGNRTLRMLDGKVEQDQVHDA